MSFYYSHSLSARDEAIKAELLEKKRRGDLWLELMRKNTPESLAEAKRMEEEDARREKLHREVQEKKQKTILEARRKEEMGQLQALEAVGSGKVLKRLGDYRQLYFYRKSKVIFDLTFAFADRYITTYHDRTKDQMVQAARSGKQNFVEGLQDGQADWEQAFYLVSIGQGSLQELQEDYEDYLRTRGLQIWDQQHKRFPAMQEFCKANNDIEVYASLFPKMNDEELANMALTLIHQTDFLVESFLRRLEKEYIAEGGVRENMRRIRSAALGRF